MIEPEDYGLSDVQTFAHIGDPSPSPDHSVFWKHWYARLIETSPGLTLRTDRDESDPSATHEFISMDGVRIGCVLVLPSDNRPVSASLVAVHGYKVTGTLKDSARKWKSIADTGVAVLVIRLRGYPGSQIGIGDQTTPDELGAGWIARGFASDKHEDWILPKAIGDVCNACRVMRNALLERNTNLPQITIDPKIDHPGVFLTGTSLGGGLATIAAAQLIGRLSGESIIDRLAVALPSLGAWRWRLDHRHSGTTLDIGKTLTHHCDRREQLINRLRLCDAVVHGRKVRVPTLGMLARKDDVAPAPSTAAVFNAIDADPGRKWRFVVPFGHFEGGIANARRHALFDQALVDFFDPSRLPMESMSRWEPILHLGSIGASGNAPTLGQDEHTK
ncbi:MAG: acetylxylan esterase [Phycisphaerales bacterium]|nr:acetylxylan esterase [Phycisphaerales bacterium]